MSKTTTSKQPMSGLRSIKRDFSSSSLPPASQESVTSDPDTIPWQPTPPKKLSGLEQRLKDIQDALKGQVASSESVLASSQSQSQSQKRPSTSQNPPAKRRQLPSSWSEKETKPARPAYPSASTTRAFGTTRQLNADANETLVIPVAKSGSSSKPTPVALSQEQTYILKLVENGLSLFYTGSAGESSFKQLEWDEGTYVSLITRRLLSVVCACARECPAVTLDMRRPGKARIYSHFRCYRSWKVRLATRNH